MFISQNLKKENIAEYLLYMYQIEDIIRAQQFDLDRLVKLVVEPSNLDKQRAAALKEWYRRLVFEMKQEEKMVKGHLNRLNEVVAELQFLHRDLLSGIGNETYQRLYAIARPNILALRQKSGNTQSGEIQACLDGLYGYLLLKIQKKEINQDTSEAMKSIQEMIANLSAHYLNIKSIS
jgi:hypothetical protein